MPTKEQTQPIQFSVCIDADGDFAQELLLGIPIFLWVAFRVASRIEKKFICITSNDPAIQKYAARYGFQGQKFTTTQTISLPSNQPFWHHNTLQEWSVDHPPVCTFPHEQLVVTSEDTLQFARDIARGLLPTSPYAIPAQAIRHQFPIRLLVLDCDGVLTDGHLAVASDGTLTRRYSIHDGGSLLRLQKADIPVYLVSAAAADESMIRRMEMLHIPRKRQFYGIRNKEKSIRAIIAEHGALAWEVAFIGDDLIDINAMQWVGHPYCPANAALEVLQCGAIRLTKNGGHGCIREITQIILEQKVEL